MIINLVKSFVMIQYLILLLFNYFSFAQLVAFSKKTFGVRLCEATCYNGTLLF